MQSFMFQNVNTGQCLVPASDSTISGALLTTDFCTSGDSAQWWNLVPQRTVTIRLGG